jgi:hypothetical protein
MHHNEKIAWRRVLDHEFTVVVLVLDIQYIQTSKR